MTKIILLGRCCRVSLDLIKINYKQESSLFEWNWTDTLSEINIIIQKILNNEPIKITLRDGNHFLDSTNIKTCHYIKDDYQQIFNRRARRFINNIKNENEILFIRDDVLSTINFSEIVQFFTLIKNFNSKLVFKFLLLSDKNKFTEISYNNLYHKIYNPCLYKFYINECFAISENNGKSNRGDISD